MLVLLAADSRHSTQVVVSGLERAGYHARHAASASAALGELESRRRAFPIGAILVDAQMQGDGAATLVRIAAARAHVAAPLLVFGHAEPGPPAHFDGDDEFLRLGASDSLKHPSCFAELFERLRSLTGLGPPREEILQGGDVEIDIAWQRVRRGRLEIALTPREYRVLECLLREHGRQPGRPVSRAEIVDFAWDLDYQGPSNAVDESIYRIRSKVDVPFGVKRIQTVRGAGYRIA